MSTKVINLNGVRYVDRLIAPNQHAFHNETQGGTYKLEHGVNGWHVYPAHSVTLRHNGYSIGLAATLADVPAVVYAFEY